MKKKLTAAIINLGCKVNKYESDSMKDKLTSAGIYVVEPEDVADIYIVNTCSVTNMAQRKSRQMLRRAKKWNPEAVVIAAGCYVNAEHDVLKQEDFVDVVVSNNCKKDIAEVIFEYLNHHGSNDYYIDVNQTKEYEEMGSLEASHLDHQRAYIKIQDGCNQFCSYCIIPYTRGRVRSRKPEQILNEIERLAEQGVKEFVLTGIHISSYGVDFRGHDAQYDEVVSQKGIEDRNTEEQNRETVRLIDDLGKLVSAIADIPEVKRIRLGSLEPRIITKEFLTEIGKSGKVCPHFHLSLQSACNETLKRMNRKYTIEMFEEKCNMIRSFFELPAITTDVIVGFPGETEEEFKTTVLNLTRIGLYEIHVFKYSVRAGTVAEKMENQIPEDVKNSRSDILLSLTKRQKEQFEQSLTGMEDEVLVEEIADEKDFPNLRTCKRIDNSVGEFENASLSGNMEQKYYAGHTRRYIKVKLEATKDVTNQILSVMM